jgi:hypothetical protein
VKEHFVFSHPNRYGTVPVLYQYFKNSLKIIFNEKQGVGKMAYGTGKLIIGLGPCLSMFICKLILMAFLTSKAKLQAIFLPIGEMLRIVYNFRLLRLGGR